MAQLPIKVPWSRIVDKHRYFDETCRVEEEVEALMKDIDAELAKLNPVQKAAELDEMKYWVWQIGLKNKERESLETLGMGAEKRSKHFLLKRIMKKLPLEDQPIWKLNTLNGIAHQLKKLKQVKGFAADEKAVLEEVGFDVRAVQMLLDGATAEDLARFYQSGSMEITEDAADGATADEDTEKKALEMLLDGATAELERDEEGLEDMIV